VSEIRSGDLTLGLVPEIGGSVAYFRKGTFEDWFQGAPPLFQGKP
jgi:hypothetical protein